MMGPIGHHVISYGNSDSVFTRRHSRVETNSHNRGADVAQLVELRTGTPSTQVRIPGAASSSLHNTCTAEELVPFAGCC